MQSNPVKADVYEQITKAIVSAVEDGAGQVRDAVARTIHSAERHETQTVQGRKFVGAV